MAGGQNHRHAARISEQLHHGDVLGLAAGHVNGCDSVPLGVHLIDYVSGLEGDGFEG